MELNNQAGIAARKQVDKGSMVIEGWADEVIPKAIAYARSLLRSVPDAEDVVHDALCRLLSHKEYDLESYGEKLLFRSVTNACINRWKRKRKMLSLDYEIADAGPIMSVVPSSAPDPVDTVMNRELHELVGRALGKLPPGQRAALELKVMGYSLKETAEMLRITVSNAGVLIHRARKAMTVHMEPVLSERKAT